MKKLILTLIAVISFSGLSAQYFQLSYLSGSKNPDGLNNDAEFPVGGGISAGWTNILAGNQVSAKWSTRRKLPFTFEFNGVGFDSFYVSSSGVLTFSSTVGTAPGYGNAALPSASIPDNSICVRGLKTDGANSNFANIVTKTFGAAGSQQYWITYSAYNENNLGNNGFLWFSIMLEEGTNKIYFVDQRQYGAAATKLTLGVQINSTTAITIAGSPNIAMASNPGSLMDDNRYWVLTPDPQPAYDVQGLKSKMPDYHAMVQGSSSVKAIFKNIGTTTLTSCDVNYSIDGGATVTAPGTINLATNGEVEITSSSPWTPTVEGTYSVAVWLSNLNGNTDENLNNDVVAKSIQVVENFVVRMPLHEVFTSSTCVPCVAGNRNTDENIFPLYPDQFTVIKYQMSWPPNGDPYYTTEGNVRRGLYGVNSIPNMQVDGGWNQNAGSYTTALFDQFKAKPSFIKIDAKHTINFKKISVDVKITPMVNYNNANMKVFVAVLEKKTEKNVKTNGETEFHHVLKKMLPDANGTTLGNVAKNVEKTFTTMNYNIPGNYRLPTDAQSANIINLNTENSIEELNDCEVVVFVQDIVTKEVFQSANSVGTILSVDDVNAGENTISIYPNPSNAGSTNVSFQLNNPQGVTVKVYNTMGQLVYEVPVSEITAGDNILSIDSSKFSSGIYTVKIEGNGFSTAQKFIVQ